MSDAPSLTPPSPPPAPATRSGRFSRWAQPFRAAVWIWTSALALLLIGLVWLAAQTALGMRETRVVAEREIAQAEVALRDVPLLHPDEIARLRRSRNARHVALAESLGVEPPDRLSALPDGLVRVDTLASVVALDGTHSDPLLTPDGAHALRLGALRDTCKMSS